MVTVVARNMGTISIQIPALLLISCVSLGRCLNLSELQFHRLSVGPVITALTSERSCKDKLSEIIYAEGLELYLVRGRHSESIRSTNTY